MTLQFPDRLPSHAPVLVNTDPRINLGHRPENGAAACGSEEPMVHGTAIQCLARRILPCPACWCGRQPW